MAPNPHRPDSRRHRRLERHRPGHRRVPRVRPGPMSSSAVAPRPPWPSRWPRSPPPAGSAEAHVLDVRQVDEMRGFVARATESTGRLDIMVNNAGLSHPEAILEESDPEHWRVMLETNVFALLVGSQAAVEAMRACGAEGHLVNISSVAAQRPDSGVYGATKHAVNCINNSLRRELMDDPIKVLTVMPGAIATNFARNFDSAVLQGLVGVAGAADPASRDHQGRAAARRGPGRRPGRPPRSPVHPRGRGRGRPVGRDPPGRASTCRRSWSDPSATSTCSRVDAPRSAVAGRQTRSRKTGVSGGRRWASRPEAAIRATRPSRSSRCGQFDADHGGPELAVVLLHVLEQDDVVGRTQALVEKAPEAPGCWGKATTK